MLNTGRILEASDLGIEYINAVLGNGIENFGLETYLTSVTQMAVWLPLNTLEVLLYELKEISEKPIFSEVCIFLFYIGCSIEIEKTKCFRYFWFYKRNIQD